MNRCLAFLFALCFAAISVSSACIAQPSDWIRFTLESERGGADRIQASFRDEVRDRERNSWSTGFHPSDFVGLDVAGFRGAGSRPLRFALMREAGRLDCAGNGGGGMAIGNCSFTADAAFA